MAFQNLSTNKTVSSDVIGSAQYLNRIRIGKSVPTHSHTAIRTIRTRPKIRNTHRRTRRAEDRLRRSHAIQQAEYLQLGLQLIRHEVDSNIGLAHRRFNSRRKRQVLCAAIQPCPAPSPRDEDSKASHLPARPEAPTAHTAEPACGPGSGTNNRYLHRALNPAQRAGHAKQLKHRGAYFELSIAAWTCS